MKLSMRKPTNKRLLFRTRIAISFIIFALIITLFIGFISARLSSDVLLDMSKQLSENNFNVVYNSLDDYFHNVEKYSTLLIRMPELQQILKLDSYPENDPPVSKSKIHRSVLEIVTLASYSDNLSFNNVNIYCKNGFSYNYTQDNSLPFTDYEGCVQHYIDNEFISDGYKPSTWCDIIKTTDVTGKESKSFINIRVLYDVATFEEIGMIVTGIDELDLYNNYSGFSDDAYIVHKNGSIISHEDKSLLGNSMRSNDIYRMITGSDKSMETLTYQKDGDTQILTYKKLASNDIYFIVPFDYYTSNTFDTRSFYISLVILVIAGFIVSILFSMIISKGLSSSVLSLKNTVEAVQEGNLNARFKPRRNDEVSYLGLKFNEMMDQINDFFTKQAEQERATRTLELKLMQSQINPHLLYNTLDSTLWALDNKNLSQAKELIVSLSEFFKTTLSSGNTLIPLEKELELIRNYINIQRVARGKNIDLSIEGADALLKMPFIKLSIQPIVENSILHGFSGFRNNGKLNIIVEPLGIKKVQIKIIDNGIGMLENELIELNNMLKSPLSSEKMKHFGLYNIQRRIKNMFGNEYGIYVDSEVGSFTCVIMTVPLLVEGREDIRNV